jgi:hypothetical protein
LLPGLAVTGGLLALWPALLLWHGNNVAEIQGDSFTLDGLWDIPAHTDRLPLIAERFAGHLAGSKRLLAAAACASAAAWWMGRLRPVLACLWLTAAGHAAFVGLVFLATRQDVRWHLDTAFERLMFQHQFAVIEALALSLLALCERRDRSGGVRPGCFLIP